MVDPVALTRRVFFKKVYTIRASTTLPAHTVRSVDYPLAYAPLFVHIRRSLYSVAYGKLFLKCGDARLFPQLPSTVPSASMKSLWMYMSGGCVDGIIMETTSSYAYFDVEIDVYVATDVVNILEAGLGQTIMKTRWVEVEEVEATACKSVSDQNIPVTLAAINMPIDKGYPLVPLVCNTHTEDIGVVAWYAELACGYTMPTPILVPPGQCMLVSVPPQMRPAYVNALQYARQVLLIGAKNADAGDVLARVKFLALEITT